MFIVPRKSVGGSEFKLSPQIHLYTQEKTQNCYPNIGWVGVSQLIKMMETLTAAEQGYVIREVLM